MILKDHRGRFHVGKLGSLKQFEAYFNCNLHYLLILIIHCNLLYKDELFTKALTRH